MAAIAVTNRVVRGHGTMKCETGRFVYISGAFQNVTQLGNVVFWHAQYLGNNQYGDMGIYLNSATASAVQDDGGTVHVDATSMVPGLYEYKAYGR